MGDINKYKLYCNNCCKYGHAYSKCNYPITSIGIIAFRITDNNLNNYYKNLYDNKYINLDKDCSLNYNIFNKTLDFKDKIEFLLIRRKNSVGFIEFLKGKYNLNNVDYIINLFDQMISSEIEIIKNNEFNDIWNNLWTNNKYKLIDKNKIKNKFNKLKETLLDDIIQRSEQKYNNPEWGFPKGRRNYMEKNINCAIREFCEETDLNTTDFKILENIKPVVEIFKGTNNVVYKHIYFIAYCNNDIPVKLNSNKQMEEIGDIGWFNYNRTKNKIRNYHNKRINILNKIFLFISNILNNKK